MTDMSKRNRGHNDMSTDKPTDSLAALRDDPADRAIAKTEPERILIDYNGKSGAEQVHAHTAAWCVHKTGNDPLVIEPGLNIIDARRWRAYQDHPPVKTSIGRKHLTTVSIADLRGPELADLAQRTRSADALELLLTIEASKPVTAGPAKRRSNEIVEMLQRKLARAVKARKIDTSGLDGAARAQSAVVLPKTG